MPSLDDIPTLPPANLSGDDMIAVIDGSDRRSPRQATLAQLGSSIVNPAIAAASDAQAAEMREGLEAQSTAIGFLDRFDRSDRFAENAELVHNTSLPEVGGTAYHLAVATAPLPKIVSRAMEATGNSLCYIHNQVATTGGKFSIGFVVDFTRPANYLTAINNGGFTVAISNVEIIKDSGTSGDITASEPLHITIRPDGVSDSSIYPSIANLTCLNATASAGAYPWTPRQTQLPWNEKLAIILRIKGDILEIEAVGIGTLYFTHPDVSTKVGPTTYFYYEPVGPTNGTGYKHITRLYRWWACAEELEQTPGYGSMVPEVSGGPHLFPGQIRAYPLGRTAQQAADALPGASTATLISSTPTTAAKGSSSRASGGAAIFEGPVVHNYGFLGVGGTVSGSTCGFMVGAVDMNHNAPASSSAGAETNLNSSFLPIWGLENSDWERWYYAGELVGASAKRIRLNLAFGGGDPGTPGNLIDSNVSGTPLDALSGFWELEVHRYTNSTASHVFIAKLWANGVLIAAKRTAWNGTTNYVAGTLKTTTVSAGGVTLDTLTHEIARVNVT